MGMFSGSYGSWAAFSCRGHFSGNWPFFRLLMYLGQHFLPGGIFPGTGHFSGSLCILGSIFCQGAFFRELAIFPAPYVSWTAFSATGHFSGNCPLFPLPTYLTPHLHPSTLFPASTPLS